MKSGRTVVELNALVRLERQSGGRGGAAMVGLDTAREKVKREYRRRTKSMGLRRKIGGERDTERNGGKVDDSTTEDRE